MDNQKFYKINSKGKELFWEIQVEKNIITTKSYYKDGKIKCYTKEIQGKNLNKKNSTSNEEQAIKEAKSKIQTKLKYEGYNLYNNLSLNEHQSSRKHQSNDCICVNLTEPKIKCMLLKEATFKEKWIEEGCFQQPKLDGLRCLAFFFKNQWQLISRNEKEYLFLNHIKNDLNFLDCNFIYDGELMHPDGFQTLCSLATVQRKIHPAKELEEQITFEIFDIVSNDIQSKRFEHLFKFIHINTLGNSIRIVNTIEVSKVNDIKKIHEIYISKGFEGSVLRSKNALYEHKRSSLCVKIKDFDSNEYEVVGYREGTGTDKNLVVWRCKTDEGLEFECVPKLSDIQRKTQFLEGEKYLGKLLTIKHQGYTNDNIPRFPIGICFRETIE